MPSVITLRRILQKHNGNFNLLSVGTSLVPSPSFFARKEAHGALRAGKKKEGPGIQQLHMRQFFQFFSEFGHFSIFTRENVIIIGVAS